MKSLNHLNFYFLKTDQLQPIIVVGSTWDLIIKVLRPRRNEMKSCLMD